MTNSWKFIHKTIISVIRVDIKKKAGDARFYPI